MSVRALLADERAVSSVVGAIVVLAVLGSALVYVNAYHVPQKGAALEVLAREEAETALQSLALDLSSPVDGPFATDLPLRGPAPEPPLLSGIVLTPVRASGRLAFEPEGTTLRLSHVTAAPAADVPAGDPVREALPGGLMLVHDIGSATGGRALGALTLAAGAAYLESATYSLEGGAVLVRRDDGSALVAPPALQVGRGGTATVPTTTFSWRVPLLAGAAAEVGGGDLAQVSLAPGPEAAAGGGQLVHEIRIVVETDALTAWRSALEELVGSHGTVSATQTGPDAGTVTATLLPPSGTPAGTPRVELRLHAVRYEVGLAERGAG